MWHSAPLSCQLTFTVSHAGVIHKLWITVIHEILVQKCACKQWWCHASRKANKVVSWASHSLGQDKPASSVHINKWVICLNISLQSNVTTSSWNMAVFHLQLLSICYGLHVCVGFRQLSYKKQLAHINDLHILMMEASSSTHVVHIWFLHNLISLLVFNMFCCT